MKFAEMVMAFSEVSWVIVAFTLGMLAKRFHLPPLVGFLVAGFIIQHFPTLNLQLFKQLSSVGITLLLFTIGLKIKVKNLIKPHIWAVTSVHTLLTVLFFALVFKFFSWLGMTQYLGLSNNTLLIIAFALSFSSTVFVVKILEDKGEYYSRHGRIAIGVLVIQDIFAVLFMAISTGKPPSAWALGLLLLWPTRHLISRILNAMGHDELLVLLGFILSMGGSLLFEFVGIKGDLGALIMGLMLSNHSRARDMAKTMMSFKDLFLLGFFISIGLTGELTWMHIGMGFVLLALVLFKSALFYLLFTRFKLRARTSLMATLNLSNYSEFGLIVVAMCVANQWISASWLVTIAVAMTLSQILAAILNAQAHHNFVKYRSWWRRWQRKERLADDQEVDISGAEVAIIGIGRVGCGAYDSMHEYLGNRVIGIDINPDVIADKASPDRRMIQGDPSDADFWDRVLESHELKLVMIALPNINASMAVVEQLKALNFDGQIAATTHFEEEIEAYKDAGVHSVFNVFIQAGSGFTQQVLSQGMCDKILQGPASKL
ncbi:cation:proton antiporter family protein [Marinicella rhabdoformis]|uniref:cation:proton antiporter family protein n=1 Tax=Marinicella rhabdoformis TaxID=2580566 RepID=UPI0012AEB506|nr:cation:proton antiporter family protein [Marinicella rhabdoformis]